MTVEIIAEAAQGYLGDPPAKTRLLACMAAAAGADAVKFQLVYADELCTPDYVYYELFSSLEMPDEEWHALAALCRERGIGLYVDVFGTRSLALAAAIGVGAVKLHVTDLLNEPLLHEIRTSLIGQVILSAGGAHRRDLDRAVAILKDKSIVLMHGFQGYPTGNDENQIARLRVLARAYPQCTLGFADHVPKEDRDGLWIAAAALGAGATVLEKHITLARVMGEEDSEAALNPDDFAGFAANMRKAAAAIGAERGEEDFGMSAGERNYRLKMRKHVVALRDLAEGEIAGADNLCLKRTSADEPVLRDLADAVGRRLRHPVAAGRALRPEDVA